MTDQPKDFTPESMIEWAKDLAKDSAARLSQEERLFAIRSVASAFLECDVIDFANIDDPEGSFNAAAQTLYMCQLIPMIFAEAYAEVELHLTDEEQAELDREKTIESLKRSFNL